MRPSDYKVTGYVRFDGKKVAVTLLEMYTEKFTPEREIVRTGTFLVINSERAPEICRARKVFWKFRIQNHDPKTYSGHGYVMNFSPDGNAELRCSGPITIRAGA